MATLAEAMKNAEVKPPKVLYYGPPNTGKTCLACTGGQYAELLDIDGNAAPAATLDDSLKSVRNSVKYTNCQDTNPAAPDSMRKVKDRIIVINNEIVSKVYKPKILIIDSLTTLGEAAIRAVRHSKGKLLKSETNTTQQEWGIALNDVEFIISMMKSWPITVILIAHELIYSEEEPVIDANGKIAGTRDVQKKQILCIGSKLPFRIPAYFSEIWYARRMDGAAGMSSYRLQTKASGGLVARSGLGIADMTDVKVGLVQLLTSHGVKLDDPSPPVTQPATPSASPTPTTVVSK